MFNLEIQSLENIIESHMHTGKYYRRESLDRLLLFLEGERDVIEKVIKGNRKREMRLGKNKYVHVQLLTTQ